MIICKNGVDWSASAAWAQAFLSFIGIVVSGYIAAKVAQRPTLSARHQRLASLSGIADVARKALVDAKIECDEFDEEFAHLPAFEIARFTRLSEAISTLPLMEISPGWHVDGLLQLREDLADASYTMADLLKNAETGIGVNHLGERFVPAISRAEKLVGDLMRDAGQAARAEKLWWR